MSAINDLRTFIYSLESNNELRRVKAEVDWKNELGAICYENTLRRGRALLLENIKDYRIPVFTGGLLTPRKIALALELTAETSFTETVQEVKERLKKPIKPKLVSYGPCKEKKVAGDDVDLYSFPVPIWNEMDAGRFIGTFHCVVTKDPDTGWENVGMYRMQIHDKRTTGVFIWPDRHIGLHFAKYKRIGKPMPIAVAIGNDPVCPIVACTGFPYGVDEWDMAGALRKVPLEVVKCDTVDLRVPAAAEIVLEGEVPLDELRDEGPFGEHTGYYGAVVMPRPVMRVKLVTYRSNPIFQGTYLVGRNDEMHVLRSVINGAMMMRTYEDLGFPGIRNVYFHPGLDSSFTAIISIEKQYSGHPLDAARILMASKVGSMVKLCIVVDSDVNVFDLEEVIHELNIRFQPSRGLVVTRFERTSNVDPSTGGAEWVSISDKMVVDATWPMTPDWPPRKEWLNQRHPPKAKPSDGLLAKVRSRWKEYGLN